MLLGYNFSLFYVVIFCKSTSVLMEQRDCFVLSYESLRKMCSKITSSSRFCKQSCAQGNLILPCTRTFGDSCTYTMQKFRCQILNWSSCANCGPRGNRCLYTLKEPKPDESNVIRAVHFAPNLKTMENIKIAFEEINKTCAATVLQYPFNYFNYYNLIYRLQHYLLSKGESTSNDWFRVFDYGRNYCNLRNLVTGIGFDKSSKFLELTSNAVCTQYNMAICE
ncbi:uncharacterized protein LOC100880856 isoform X5 [Megachile rotundata]|uniref:uncharacterized protein LOC100880856 isoform X5 n=1 Tax=Megachile rotundata TaxID=143995 RepID=UPI003FCFD64B